MQVRLAAHAEALQHRGRGGVARLQAADDPVEAELLEAQPQHLAGGLGRVSVALVVGVQHEPDLTLPVRLASVHEDDIAHHGVAVARLDGQLERVALGLDPVARLADHLFHSLTGARLPVQVAHHLRARLDVVQDVDVGLTVGPQQQALGLDRVLGAEHRWRLPIRDAYPRYPRGVGGRSATCASRSRTRCER